MKIEKIKEKLIAKLKENLKKGRFVVVPYSGGKDSHLATIKLIEKGFYPLLFYFSAGEKSVELTNAPDISSYIQETLIEDLKLTVIKKLKIEKVFNGISTDSKEILSLINKLVKGYQAKEVYLHINDNEPTLADIKKLKKIKEIFTKHSIPFITLSDLFPNPTLKRVMKELKKYKCRCIIINTDLNCKEVIGKELDTNTLKVLKEEYLKDQILIKKEPLTNLFQTMIISSPLFKKSIKPPSKQILFSFYITLA